MRYFESSSYNLKIQRKKNLIQKTLRSAIAVVSLAGLSACETASDVAFLTGSVVDGVVYMGTLGTVYTGLGPGAYDLVEKGELNSYATVQEVNEELVGDIVSVGAVVAESYSAPSTPSAPPNPASGATPQVMTPLPDFHNGNEQPTLGLIDIWLLEDGSRKNAVLASDNHGYDLQRAAFIQEQAITQKSMPDDAAGCFQHGPGWVKNKCPKPISFAYCFKGLPEGYSGQCKDGIRVHFLSPNADLTLHVFSGFTGVETEAMACTFPLIPIDLSYSNTNGRASGSCGRLKKPQSIYSQTLIEVMNIK